MNEKRYLLYENWYDKKGILGILMKWRNNSNKLGLDHAMEPVTGTRECHSRSVIGGIPEMLSRCGI